MERKGRRRSSEMSGIAPERKTRLAPADRPNYNIILNQYDDGYILVKCTELKGLVTDGRSMDEALANAAEAVSAHLEADGDTSGFNLIIKSTHQ